MPRRINVPELVAAVLAGSKAGVAKAITLVESSRVDHREQARELLAALTKAPQLQPTIRIGLSGVPGAGKSTFTDAMGCGLIESGHKVAVLAVDPSSSRTGGSVLGDRTRMGALAAHDSAYIRPSPSGCHLGGVARATREAMLIVEAAGYDVVIVETVGVGQSEVAVAGMVDTFLLLALSRAGDQLQGIKRGILEIADVIAVNKADGENLTSAQTCAKELSIAMKMINGDSGRRVPVLTCSAYAKTGLDDVWQAILGHRTDLETSPGLAVHRQRQQVDWMWAQITSAVTDATRATPALVDHGRQLEQAVMSNSSTALDAAQEFLQHYAHEISTMSWASR